jgi:signal transduction histidine kinase
MRMKAVAQSVVSRMNKLNPGRIHPNLNGDFTVVANPVHLDQMITNLMTNALKFSPATSPIDISITGHTLEIRDSGPGIPAEVRQRLGEPFNVGSMDNDNAAGNGLGLAMVTAVARLYQWKFEVAFESGTRAIVEFPAENG